MGPFFKLIYTLLRDPLVKYEFSIVLLPTRIRQVLESTTLQPFYEELILRNLHTKQISSLLLNPFDYYFFHFAYHLINPGHQKSGTTVEASWNTVYFNLCCDYIIHFLPIDVVTHVAPMINFFCDKGSLNTLPLFKRPIKHSNLIRLPATEVTNEYPQQSVESHPRVEIWRSETVLVVFIDIWLNNDQIIHLGQNYSGSPSRMQFNELPTGEYIRIIRVFVKHIHAFSAAVKADDTHMLQLRKAARLMMQAKIYVFLDNLVKRWPLDGSFRLVLELWLSFIQPWRYQGPTYIKNVADPNPDVEDTDTAPMKCVGREYLQFMAENLLAYVVIFQQLLPRFCRIDLASPKMSLMLFRLTKVFSQPNLVSYLREIESSLSFDKFTNSPSQMNISYSPFTTEFECSQSPNTALNSSSRWKMIVKQKIYELEGPGFFYRPLFATPPSKEVYELINNIRNAKEAAENIVKWRMEEEARQGAGIIGSIRSFLMLTECSNDEFTIEERKRVPQYLEFSLQYLKEIFQITETEDNKSAGQMLDSSSGSFSISEDVRFLTPQRVWERVKRMKYEGDPDLMTISTYENTILVRMLYDISSKLNEQFGHLMQKWYYENSYFGRLVRQVLLPPMTAYSYDKSSGRSVRKAVHLPPRLSLRPLASYRFLAYIIIGVVLTNLSGYSVMNFVLAVFMVWLLFICLKALTQHTV